MWHVVVSKVNKRKTVQIKCFPDDAKPRGTETIYEVHGSYEFLVKMKNNKLKLEEQDETRFYKCVARDQMDRIISTQFYIITVHGMLVIFHLYLQGCGRGRSPPSFESNDNDNEIY